MATNGDSNPQQTGPNADLAQVSVESVIHYYKQALMYANARRQAFKDLSR